MVPFRPSKIAKEQNNFYKKSVYALMRDCIAAIRERVPECPTLMERKGGVIRFDFVADEAGLKFEEWLGVPMDMPKDFVPESPQFVYKLMPNWLPTIWCDETITHEHGPVDCAAYSEMKAASCAIRYQEGAGFTSGPIPASTGAVFKSADEWGFAEHKGCLVYIITVKGDAHLRVGEIYVSVSGGTQEEDDMLARCTAPIVQAYFENDPSVEILPASNHFTLK